MTDATELSAEVARILGQLSGNEKQALDKSKGYAYEAYVLVAIGTELEKLGWSWNHPSKGATFARGNGGGISLRTTQCSHLTRGSRALVQGLTVQGIATTHDLDLAVCSLGSSVKPFPWQDVLAAVETKNHVKALSVGEARNMLGLGCELRTYRRPTGWFSLYLIASGAVSGRTTAISSCWSFEIAPDASPSKSSKWVTKVASDLNNAY